MRISVFLLFAFVSLSSFSQAVLYEANELFEEEQFFRAIELYEKAYKRKQTYQCTERLGYCFLYLKDIQSAQYWFEKALKFSDHDPKLNQILGEIHKQKKEYATARLYYDAWGNEDKTMQRISYLYAEKCIEILKDKYPNGGFETRNLTTLNTKYDEFSPAWMDNQIVFSSDRLEPGNPTGKKINGQTGTPFLSMYTTSLIKDKLTDPVPLWDEEIHELHEGPKCFTSEGIIYYTSVDESADLDSSVMPLNIYKGRLEGHSIVEKEAFEHNEEKYSDGHPYISQDGQRLYFISDRQKGYGGTDVYICYKNGDSWSPPLNMGPAINSEFDERFPYERNEKEMYFSSNRPSSMGGLDIYRSVKSDGLWQLAENMGEPLNSSRDDFGILFYPGSDNGILSSTREGGLGNDDLYGFTYKEELDFFKTNPNGIEKEDLATNPAKNRLADGSNHEDLKKKDPILSKPDTNPSTGNQPQSDPNTGNRLNETNSSRIIGDLSDPVNKNTPLQREEGDINGTLEVRDLQLIKDEEDSSLYVTGQIVEILENGEVVPAKGTEVVVYNKITAEPAVAQTDDYGQFVLKGSQRYSSDGKQPLGGYDKSGQPVQASSSNSDPSGIPDAGRIGTDKNGIPIYDSPTRKGAAPPTYTYDPKGILGYYADGTPVFIQPNGYLAYFNESGTPKILSNPNEPQFDDQGYPLLGNSNGTKPNNISNRDNIQTDFVISPTKTEYFNLRANKSGYLAKGVDFTTDPLSSRVTVTGEQDALININYDFDDYRINNEAAIILQDVIVFLQKHPELDVVLRSYTDLRGSAEYNQNLSKLRAREVKKHLVSKGINANRLVSIGEGESNPILRNAKTESQHRVNRRTEFELIRNR